MFFKITKFKFETGKKSDRFTQIMDCQMNAADDLLDSMICIGRHKSGKDEEEEEDDTEVKLLRHKKMKTINCGDLQMINLRKRLYEMGEKIDRKDANKLSQCLLIGDEINVYMGLLNEKYGSTKSVYCLESWYVESLLLAKGRGKISDTTKMGKFFNVLIGDSTCTKIPKRIIIPLYHPKLLHWTLICICPYTHHIILIDPYDGKETVYSRTRTSTFKKMVKISKVIIDLMFFYKHHSNINHIFKTNTPWAICRAFQVEPQVDYQSCGFYVIKCARLCCERESLADIFIFSFGEIDAERKTISEEIIAKELYMNIDVKIIGFTGIEQNTHNFKYRTSNKCFQKMDITDSDIMSPEKRVKCLINPNFVSRRTEPTISWFESMITGREVKQKDSAVKLNIYLVEQLKSGSDFTIIINPNSVNTQYSMALAFDVITKCNPNIVQKNINELNILIISNEIYTAMDDTDYIASLKYDRDNNDMVFENEGDGKTESKVAIFNEILACLFHSLCRSCKTLVIYSLKEDYKFQYNVKSNQYYVLQARE